MERTIAKAWIERWGADEVVSRLRGYLSEPRQQRIEHVLRGRLNGLAIAIEAPSDPHNAAAIVRTSEAMGVLGVHVIAAEGRALHASSTTQGAFHWVDTHHHEHFDAFRRSVSGYRLAGAVLGATFDVEQIPIDEPICILLGNEQRGLSATARSACSTSFRIPMFGMSESLNLSVAAAITLYSVARRLRASLGTSSDLDDAERAKLRALYYIGSVDERLANGLLR